MSPVVSEPTDADFVVVERLQSLCRLQKTMSEDLEVSRSRLSRLGIRMAAVERAAEINLHLRRVMLSFAAAATPVVLSVMLDQNLPPQPTPAVDFARSISKLLLAFAACVGIPLLLQAIIDLREVKVIRMRPVLRDAKNTPSGDQNSEDPGEDDTGEDDTGEEGDGEKTDEEGPAESEE